MKASKIKKLYEESKCLGPVNDIRFQPTTTSSLGGKTLRFIKKILQEIKPRNLLEFGSGLSTLFIHESLKKNTPHHLYVVEHSEYFLKKTKGLVGDVDCITYFLCPIKGYNFKRKGFAAYDDSYLLQMPNNLKLDFVLIDGPPGNRFGREATLYQIAPYLSSSTMICLDDANRRPEKEALANWRRVWRNGMDVVHFPELKKGFAVIQLKDPSITSRCPFDFSDIVLSRIRAINALIREKKRRLRREG